MNSIDTLLRDVVRAQVEEALEPVKRLIARISGARNEGRRARTSATKRGCAIQGCSRVARSKGYCASHYQKLRLLVKTHRLPDSWKDDAPPGSVLDVVLPRGRAGAKSVAEARRRR